MEIKRLNAEDAFAEIARLERVQEYGVVVNIAEKHWVGSAPDDAFGDTVREYDMPVFHSDYRPGMATCASAWWRKTAASPESASSAQRVTISPHGVSRQESTAVTF